MRNSNLFPAALFGLGAVALFTWGTLGGMHERAFVRGSVPVIGRLTGWDANGCPKILFKTPEGGSVLLWSNVCSLPTVGHVGDHRTVLWNAHRQDSQLQDFWGQWWLVVALVIGGTIFGGIAVGLARSGRPRHDASP